MRKVFFYITLHFFMVLNVYSQVNCVELFERNQWGKPYFMQEGYSIRLWVGNNGLIGSVPLISGGDPFDTLNNIGHATGIEHPIGTQNIHLGFAGLWVGGNIHRRGDTLTKVSTVYSFFGSDGMFCEWCEMYVSPRDGDISWKTSILNQHEPNRKGFDDDSDGLIDEDELDGHDNDGDWLEIRDDLNHNGKPDHGEPNVDEDYAALSESDLYLSYRDTFPDPVVPNHVPLGVKVFHKFYAWKKRVKEPILPMEFIITSTGVNELRNVYVGFFVFPQIISPPFYFTSQRNRGYIAYLPDVRTVYAHSVYDSLATPLGVTLLGASKPLQSLKFSFLWFTDTNPLSGSETEQYNLLSSGTIMQDQPSDIPTGLGNFFLIGLGPFDTLSNNDTIRLALAFICSERSIETGFGNLKSVATTALAMYERGFAPLAVPPSPPLKIIPGDNRVTLDFQWFPEHTAPNPLEVWDDYNSYVNTLPESHWRKRNPPPGKQKGGRVFEGFRIWRSDFPTFEEKSFALLHQFDIADDLNIGPQIGLQFTYTDSNIVRGKRYWYAVTSYSIPDYVINTYTDPSGQTVIDTLFTEAVESFLHENAVQVPIPFAPSYTAGKVKVVPNPYRTDMDYTYEGGGWEGLGRQWVEDKRVVWFIHLPPKCTIRIFTIAGEVVKTISHDDAQREANGLAVGQEEFILLSESNRALASGIYVYLVESEYGTQTGKFVVIR
jgi:hypothetical protein